ncbi:zinc-binding dehydrogenase [Luedemannella flava]|uniref:zinc-binding dehydrogenase n=1 Tax=Luedemannella flava TaxID=349316 RepID=UPI0031D4E20C
MRLSRGCATSATVRVASVGVCGSDVHYFEHGWIGTHVAIVDVNDDRLRLATELGIDQAIDARTRPDLAAVEPDLLLECTGAEAVVRSAIAALRPAGTAMLVGMGAHADAPLPVAAIQARELTVTYVPHLMRPDEGPEPPIFDRFRQLISPVAPTRLARAGFYAAAPAWRWPSPPATSACT